MIEKHYGDARVDGQLLDEMIGGLEASSRTQAGTLPNADEEVPPLQEAEATELSEVPERAGDRGRTGDVQLGKLSWPLWSKGFSVAVAEMG